MGNLYGALYVFRVLLKPSLLLPRLVIKDIRDLDFQCLKARGITGLVFDKDNCLTKPHVDHLATELEETWNRILDIFPGSVLVVSNSAGTVDDPSLLAAASVSRSLRVPVLIHKRKKPACAADVIDYFTNSEHDPSKVFWPPAFSRSSLQIAKHNIMVFGDRSMTDTVLANKMHSSEFSVVPVLTERLWAGEGPGTALMRFLEGSSRRLLTFTSRKFNVPKARPKDDLDRCLVQPVRSLPFGARRISRVGSLLRSKLPMFGRRSLWTTSTLIHDDPQSLVTEAEHKLDQLSAESSLFFGLSKNIPADQLSACVNKLQNLSCRSIVGSLTDAMAPNSYTLSMAVWTPDPTGRTVVAFHSTIKGKPRIALGREVKPELMQDRESLDNSLDAGMKDWSSVFGANASGLQAKDELPDALRKIDPSRIERIMYFSDEAPEGLIRTLDSLCSSTSTLGILASSTPFVTGRRMTLFKDQSIVSEGAVGIAVIRGEAKSTEAIQPSQHIFPGWEPLGHPLEITDAQGNIVLTLAGRPAARVLLELAQGQADMENDSISKESEYYIGTVAKSDEPCPPQEASSISRITSGDPKRGAMAVDTEQSLGNGQHIQFYSREDTTDMLVSVQSISAPSILCATSPSLAVELKDDVFGIATENGFIVTPKGNGKSWICSLQGSMTVTRL